MLKKLCFPLLLLSSLLFACEASTGETKSSPGNEEESVIEKVEDTIPTEGWKQHALNSTWYQNLVIPSDDSYTEMIDFEGDEIPEFFIGYSGQQYGYIIGKYNRKDKVWEQWTTESYETTKHGAISFKNTLMGPDNKAIALITNFTAGTPDSLEVVHLLKVADDGERIISGRSYRLYDDSDLKVDPASNSFTIQSETHTKHFTIRDNIVSSADRTSTIYTGLPILKNEQLKKLLNHDFFTTNIIFGDTYPIAQSKAGQPNQEDYYEGGLCSFYDNYFFCLSEEGVAMDYYYLSNFTNVSKTALEKAINQSITISSYERFENPDDVVYYAIFEDDNLYFQAEFTNDQDNAELTKLTISLNAIDQ